MFRLLKMFFAGFIILLSSACYGQESANIPLGALPMQFNSSFAGQVGSPRFSSNFHYGITQESNSRSRGYQMFTSYDQFIPAIRSGIGLTAGYGNGKYDATFNTTGGGNTTNYFRSLSSNTSLMLSIAPKLSLKGKYTLSPSLDISLGATDIKQSTDLPPLGRLANGKMYALSSRVGLLFNTNKFYAGYSVHLFNRRLKNSTIDLRGPAQSYSFQSYLQTGYNFQKSAASKFSFTPQLVFSISKLAYEPRLKMGLESFNLTFRYKQFIWGANNQGLHIGWQTDRIRLMLTNNYGLRSGFNTGLDGYRYEGNLSFRYILGSKDQRRGRGW